jgi:FkbM family methyltransferase
MQADERLRRSRIRILPIAASDRDSEAPFFVLDAEYVANRNLGRRGMSSLHRRTDGSQLAEIVQVPTKRLDSLLGAERVAGALALWVDTEGMAFETIAGAEGILGRTRLVHVEVETVPCIGATQRLFPDVEKTLLDAGFVLFATDYPTSVPQFNALFVRADLLSAKAGEIRWHVGTTRLRRSMKLAVRPLVPSRLRRYVAYRLTAVRRP